MLNIDKALLENIGFYLFYAIQYLSFFIFAFIGSLLKEMYNTNTDYDYNFDPYKVISGTFVSTFATVVFKHYYPKELDWELMIVITFVFGLLGYEIFTKLTSLEKIFDFIDRIKSITDIKSSDSRSKDKTHIRKRYRD